MGGVEILWEASSFLWEATAIVSSANFRREPRNTRKVEIFLSMANAGFLPSYFLLIYLPSRTSRIVPFFVCFVYLVVNIPARPPAGNPHSPPRIEILAHPTSKTPILLHCQCLRQC